MQKLQLFSKLFTMFLQLFASRRPSNSGFSLMQTTRLSGDALQVELVDDVFLLLAVFQEHQHIYREICDCAVRGNVVIAENDSSPDVIILYIESYHYILWKSIAAL